METTIQKISYMYGNQSFVVTQKKNESDKGTYDGSQENSGYIHSGQEGSGVGSDYVYMGVGGDRKSTEGDVVF